jgi:chromosome partitioning protein
VKRDGASKTHSKEAWVSDFIPWRRTKETPDQSVRTPDESEAAESVTPDASLEPSRDERSAEEIDGSTLGAAPLSVEPSTDPTPTPAASSPSMIESERSSGPPPVDPSPPVAAEIPTDAPPVRRPRVDRGWGAFEPGVPQPEAGPATRPLDRVGPRIIAVANQKGGVGKTTTTVNLGAAVAELGHRVLIIDLDPQGNASTGLGINPRSLEASMYDVLLHDVPLDDAIEAAAVRNLFVAPANLDLAGAEIELVPAFSREMRLKNAIRTVADDFDLVLIDCPPSLGLLTVNAFAAANEVLVPIQCEYYALEGLGQLLRNVDLVRRNLNASLELSAIVLVMYDARTNLAAQVAAEVREHFGSKVCRSVIPRTVRLSEAPSFGQPITVFDPTSRGALAYRDLAMEVVGEPS